MLFKTEIPLFFNDIEICKLDETNIYYLQRKKYLVYDKEGSKCVITDKDAFMDYCKRMKNIPVYKKCFKFFREAQSNG